MIEYRFDAFHVHCLWSVNLYVTSTLNVDISCEFISAVNYWTVTWRVIKLWINERELYLILLLRRAHRIHFLLTYNYLDLGTKESAAVSLINRRWQRHRQRRARRQAWVYPWPQGWFGEMYNNRLLPALWKTCEGGRISSVEIHVRSNTCANEQKNKFHVYKIWIHKCIVITVFAQKDDKLSTK